MNEFKIGDNSAFISFKVINPTLGPSSNNLVFFRAEARMQIANYSAIEQGFFLAEELIEFHNDLKNLYDTLKGNATFTTIEGWIQISITGNGRGNLTLDCYLSSGDGTIRLESKFSLDQTYLPKVLSQLDRIIAKMP